MKFGRAIGFSMENDQLLLTIDERHTGKRTGFDVLEVNDGSYFRHATKETTTSKSV